MRFKNREDPTNQSEREYIYIHIFLSGSTGLYGAYIGVYRVYFGIMEKKMETTV